MGFARFMTHFEDKTFKTLSTVKPKNKQTNKKKKENKVLSSVPRSLQLVKNQKKKKILQDELPLTSCAGENNSDLPLTFGLTQELKKKKRIFCLYIS